MQAQNSRIDSLTSVLSVHAESDSIRVNILYDLAYAHFQSDMDVSRAYLKEAELMSNELDYIRGKARVCYLKGILENIQSNYDQSLSFFRQSLEYYQLGGDQHGVASNYTAFGITYYDQSKYDEAIQAYEKASEIYEKQGNKRELITILINTGNAYSELGRFEEAISNYHRALVESEAINDEDGVSFVNSNLGILYKVQGNYPLAIEKLNKSLEYDIKTGDSHGMADKFNDLGEVYTSIEKYDQAREYFMKSLKISSSRNNSRLTAIVNGNLGDIYLLQKDYQNALEHYRMSLETSQVIENPKQTAISFNSIGEIKLLLNDPVVARENFLKAKEIGEGTGNLQVLPVSLLGIAETYVYERNYRKALLFTLEAQKIAEDLVLMERQKEVYELLSTIYENTGQYQKALLNHQLFKSLNDSLFNKENIEKIAQLEYEYQYKQALDSANIRELELTQTVMTTSQDLAKSRQNFLWAVIGILLVSILLGAIAFYQKYHNIKARTENIITEQKLLRSQMTPHFVFNSLSVLQGMILNKEEKKSVSYLSKFSRLLRITLENSRDQMVLLSQELLAIENYLALQSFEDESYSYTITIDSIDAAQFKIPPMLIQPFIENAIEHAFGEQKTDRKIVMQLKYANEELICVIQDNGIGINAMKENRGGAKKSLATKITSERLHILSTNYKMKGSMIIEDRIKYGEKGTIVTLMIPYEKLGTV